MVEVYLVGGAVRDELLGRPIVERDWVVVGATPEEMRDRGFRQVGKDFPVFLHPETGEEYALARIERKTGRGYHEFEFHCDPTVSLEQDLRRRDLTINAMARTSDGRLIDPYHGVQDLQARVLRNVSEAFSEDPVRVLRIARFAARFAELNFSIAAETQNLMKRMVAEGEVDALVPERVWAETVRALGESTPQRFFEVLRKCGALGRVFPEVDRLFGVPQPIRWHPEVDTGVHTLLTLAQCVRLGANRRVRFAALVHDLGKGTTPREEWPSHRGHEQRSYSLVRNLCARLRIPRDFRDLALLVAEHHTRCHRALELRPATVLNILDTAKAFRDRVRLDEFLLACEADARGRTGLEDRPYPQASLLRAACDAAVPISAKPFVAQGLQGSAISEAVRAARVRAIAAELGRFKRSERSLSDAG